MPGGPSWPASEAQREDPELAPLLDQLFETFIAESWDYRDQIIPLRVSSAEGMERVAEVGLPVEVVCLDTDHKQESFLRDLNAALDLYPNAVVLGGDLDREGVPQALEEVATQRDLRIEVDETGWRIAPPPPDQPPAE